MEEKFNLARNTFKGLSFAEAEKEMRQHKDLSIRERFQIMNYLNSIAYNYPLALPSKMVKIFSGARTLKND
jgi:hypothetical protein